MASSGLAPRRFVRHELGAPWGTGTYLVVLAALAALALVIVGWQQGEARHRAHAYRFFQASVVGDPLPYYDPDAKAARGVALVRYRTPAGVVERKVAGAPATAMPGQRITLRKPSSGGAVVVSGSRPGVGAGDIVLTILASIGALLGAFLTGQAAHWVVAVARAQRRWRVQRDAA